MAYVQGAWQRMKICVLIPSFNEEKTIGWLVRSVRELGHDVIVIDDGSMDHTAKMAQEAGAEVIINEQNMGKGASLRKAFKILIGRSLDAAVVMDGDGQHLPGDLSRFVSRFAETGSGVIVGNRMEKATGMPLVRWVTNAFMSYFISKKCGQRVPDTQCGYRLISMEVLRALELETENFEIESEILLDASRKGFELDSVPVASVYNGQHSAIHPVRDTIRFWRFILKKR